MPVHCYRELVRILWQTHTDPGILTVEKVSEAKHTSLGKLGKDYKKVNEVILKLYF